MVDSSSQSLDRGLDILELCATADRDLGIREMARTRGLSPAIVQRLVNTLAARGYLRQDEATRRYRLGHRALSIGAKHDRSADLMSLASGELGRLAAEHGLNGFLGALRSGRATYLLAVQGRGPIAIKVEIGETMPFHSTAIGKILLASMTDEKARAVLGRKPLPRVTDRTIDDPEKVIASLPRIRRTGMSIVREENLPGVISIGAPIRDAEGEVIAALSVGFPKSLDPARSPEVITPLVRAAAARISEAQGFRGTGELDAAE